MNLLMSVAVLGTLGIGAWDEAATVSFLFSVAEPNAWIVLCRFKPHWRKVLHLIEADTVVG